MLFVVVDGCKMLHNSSFDSMSHFVQDKFQSTNSEDKYKHILYMSKNTHTRKKNPQHILQTHRKHIQNIKSKQKHIFKLFIHFQFLICYTDTFSHLPTINVTFFSFSLNCSLPVGRTSGQNLRAPKAPS